MFVNNQIVPKKDPSTDLINWNTHLGKQCTRKLRRLLIKAVGEPHLFVSIRIVGDKTFWPLALIEIKVDGQVNVHGSSISSYTYPLATSPRQQRNVRQQRERGRTRARAREEKVL